MISKTVRSIEQDLLISKANADDTSLNPRAKDPAALARTQSTVEPADTPSSASGSQKRNQAGATPARSLPVTLYKFQPVYPKSAVVRAPVPADMADWKASFAGYRPPFYETDKVQERGFQHLPKDTKLQRDQETGHPLVGDEAIAHVQYP